MCYMFVCVCAHVNICIYKCLSYLYFLKSQSFKMTRLNHMQKIEHQSQVREI